MAAGWNAHGRQNRVGHLSQASLFLNTTFKQTTRSLCGYLGDSENMCAGPTSSSAPTSATADASKYRLPTNVKPTHYDLTFKTDLEALTFQGFGIIDLDVLEDTTEIQFHANEQLKISNISIHSEALKTEQVQRVDNYDFNKDEERITAKITTPLPKGSKAKLHATWEGKLDQSMAGYYYSSTEVNGRKINYTLTQFEPTAARRAFPCWDEPLLKAEYTVAMVSRSNTTNLSNMPAISEKPFLEESGDDGKEVGKLKLAKTFSLKNESGTADSKGWKVTKFQKSPLMSTYLLAFANGEFEYIESSYKSPLSGRTIPLRIYATSNVIHQAQFSLDVKAKVMPLYESIFQLEYPLPKLDTLVAHDFDAGAMENWGLITGRTSAFLLDDKKSDLAAKKRVATVTSHECAHLWFGDLVTMAWWDNLWLNEGFATLMGEVITIDRVFPEWRVYSDFINAHLNRALELDAVRSSHPIEVPVPDANQINQIFDALSYSKAGSVLRMLSAFVGEETFLKGVAIYLKKRIYGNSVTVDLWEGIAEASGLDIPTMMNNWILKIGFPVITVEETSDGIRVRQNRFLSSGDPTEEEDQTIWHVPLNILTTDESGKASINRTAVLKEREATFKLNTSRPWKLNAGTSGVYRVAYSPERWAKLGEEAGKADSVFTLEDRMGLVSDALVLAKAGIIKTSAALDLIKALSKEKENLVWQTISGKFGELNRLFWEQPEEVRSELAAFHRALFRPLVDNLGYDYSEQDSADITELRTTAITNAANAEDKEVVENLQARFKHYMETGDDSKIPADLQRIIFMVSVRYGGKEEYEAVKKVYKDPPTPGAKISAMYAMTASRKPEIIKEALQFILTDVQNQDLMYFFVGSAANRNARREIGEFFKANYDTLYSRLEAGFSISYLVRFSFEDLTTAKDADDVEAWFKDKDTSKYNLVLAQSLDRIRANAKWLERSKDDVASWLSANKDSKL